MARSSKLRRNKVNIRPVKSNMPQQQNDKFMQIRHYEKLD